MILAINTGSENNSIALYYPPKIKDEIVWQTSHTQSQELLPKIDKLLKSNKIKLSDLKTIGVFQGPGSYTGLRVGISIANTLAWSLNIPVIGIKIPKFKSQITNKFQIPKFKSQNQLAALDIAKEVQKLFSNKKYSKFTRIVEPFYHNTI